MARDWNQGSHTVGWVGDFWRAAFGVVLNGGVKKARDGVDASLAFLWVQCCDGA